MITKKWTLLVLLCFYATILITTIRCSSDDDPEPVDCNTVTITVSTELTNPSGCAATDGSIAVNASGGQTPFQYALDNGSFGDNNVFSGLSAGTYTVRVKDKNGCIGTQEASIAAEASTLNFSVAVDESGCKTTEGAITVTATGGSSTYEYSINNGSFGTSNEFTGLAAGSYIITVRDSEGCINSRSVPMTTGITYQQNIKEILDTNCAVSGCHVPGGAAPMSLQTYAVAKSRASDIKNAVLNNIMPKGGPPLSQELKDLIACWVDDNAPEN